MSYAITAMEKDTSRDVVRRNNVPIAKNLATGSKIAMSIQFSILTYGRVRRNAAVVEKARIHIVIALSVAVKPVAKRHIDDMSAVPEYRLSSLIRSDWDSILWKP